VTRQRSPDEIGVGADTACRDLMVVHGAKDQNPGSGIASAFPPWLRKSATDIDGVGGQRRRLRRSRRVLVTSAVRGRGQPAGETPPTGRLGRCAPSPAIEQPPPSVTSTPVSRARSWPSRLPSAGMPCEVLRQPCLRSHNGNVLVPGAGRCRCEDNVGSEHVVATQQSR
jgi:hypothetical protein